LDLFHPDIWHLLLILAIGFLGGFLAGMLGVGGGIVFIPLFQEMVKNHSVEADKVPYILTNSLMIVFAVGLMATIKQVKIKNTDLKASVVTGACAVLSSLSLSFLINHYNINDPLIFRYIFALILVFTAVKMLYDHLRKKETVEKVQLPPLKKFIPAGLFAGVVTSLTGLGGGIIMVPYFNKVLKLPIKFATGLSLSVIPLIALPLLLFYTFDKPSLKLHDIQSGHIVWPVILPILISSMIAAPLGVRFAQKLASKTLLTIFLCFILLTVIKTLFF
jgi:uncharacterized protein